jgi:type IV secretory pathway VirB2 component (pilin)
VTTYQPRHFGAVQAIRNRKAQIAAWMLGAMALTESQLAVAGGGSLSEVEDTAQWVLDIFSPGLLLILITLLLIGCGIAVWAGKMTGKMFLTILVGSIFVFGARTIGPKIVALF